jgi:hypothetical protein
MHPQASQNPLRAFGASSPAAKPPHFFFVRFVRFVVHFPFSPEAPYDLGPGIRRDERRC